MKVNKSKKKQKKKIHKKTISRKLKNKSQKKIGGLSEESPNKIFLEGWGTKKPISHFCCEKRRYFKFYKQLDQFKIDYYQDDTCQTVKGSFRPINSIEIIKLNDRHEWLLFKNLENQKLKILPDKNSDLNKKLYNYLSSEQAIQYIDKENILEILYQFNVERTFKFNSEKELQIFTMGRINNYEQEELTYAQRGNNSYLEKIFSDQKFYSGKEISGKLDIWHFFEISINNLSLKYINDEGIENYIKYKDIMNCGTFNPTFDPYILSKK